MLYQLETLRQPMLYEPEAGQTTTREYKDRLFRHLFSDKARAIELYNAVTGKDCTVDAEVEFWSTNALIARWNDLAYTVDKDVVVFLEQQSTPNRPMPLRMLQYFSSVLSGIPAIQRKLYGSSQVRIPSPAFYMLYNGVEKPPRSPLRLSDAFMERQGEPQLELIVQVVDIRYNVGNEILARSASLCGYAILIAVIEDGLQRGLPRDEAIRDAVDMCIELGILAAYLDENYREVLHMLGFEYDADLEREVIEEEAIEKGIEQGSEQMALNIALNMLKAQQTPAFITKMTGVTARRLRALRKELEAQV